MSEDTNLLARVDDVEIKLTLLEQSNEELSQVIIAQQTRIDELALALEQAQRQVEQLGEQVSVDDGPPPHY